MKETKSILKIFSFSILLTLLDREIKIVAQNSWQNGLEIFPYFSLHMAKNTGIAWSLPIPYWFLLPLNIVLIVIIPLLACKYLNIKNNLSLLVVSFIIGGAIGNFYDRLFYGYVIDYISIGSWPVFNLADALLSTGVFLLIVFYGKIKRTN